MCGISKRDELESIAEEIKKCRKCSLWKTRRNAVPGGGNFGSPVVFIGEAPGHREDLKGRPFVGAAGKILDEVLAKIDISKTEIYITNILKCRPPRNRGPRVIEVETCTPYLNRQLEVIKPRFVVTLGRYSTAYILSRAGLEFDGMTKVRGRIYEANFGGSKVHVLPTFHPAAALYNVQLKGDIETDLQLLKREVEINKKRTV
jgi:DNA polymerase